MQAVVIKLHFAVGSLVCIISGASDIHCIVKMGASSLGSLPITMSVSTLCSSAFVGVRMASMAVARLLMRWRPLCVPAAVTVAVCNSSVSALRCTVGLRFRTWQCYGNSLANPKRWYAPIVVSQKPQIPGICSLRCPRSLHSWGCVYDGLATWRGKGVPFQIVRPIERFIRQCCRVDLQVLE